MDAAITWGPGGGDLALEGGDLAVDGGLLTAVLVSVFSDGRAEAAPGRPLLEQDLRGYWAEERGDAYGSLLWTLSRAKALPETADRAAEVLTASLAWLVEQGIARSARAEATLDGAVLRARVELVRGTSRRWAALWDDLDLELRQGSLLLQVSAG